nr:repressor of filamentous growth 1 [Quercus suber]
MGDYRGRHRITTLEYWSVKSHSSCWTLPIGLTDVTLFMLASLAIVTWISCLSLAPQSRQIIVERAGGRCNLDVAVRARVCTIRPDQTRLTYGRQCKTSLTTEAGSSSGSLHSLLQSVCFSLLILLLHSGCRFVYLPVQRPFRADCKTRRRPSNMPNRPHGELTLKRTWLSRGSFSGITARRGSTAPPPSDPWMPTVSQGARALSLPEEQPPYDRTRKRIYDPEDCGTNSAEAGVVAKHPTLANPEISKIIGLQWQSQSQDTKDKWKALAEEEKHRHQLQYPGYRYQPKRNDRRSSLAGDSQYPAEPPKCSKCGGRSVLTPSTPHSAQTHITGSVPPTPQPVITPGSRTIPALQELNLRSPTGYQTSHELLYTDMPPSHFYPDERVDNWPMTPMTPDWKRRRTSSVVDQPGMTAQVAPLRHVPHGASGGSGSPFPFHQEQDFKTQQPSKRANPTAPNQGRRESLPSMRSVVDPSAMMAPPPKPVTGYQQHRLEYGRVMHDCSLTLPPLRTGHPHDETTRTPGTAGSSQRLGDQAMPMPFRQKILILGRVARPACIDASNPRGPLIAVEGDDADAVDALGRWLAGELRKGPDLEVQLFDGPEVDMANDGKKPMAQYHRLIAEWLNRSDDIIKSITSTAPATRNDSAVNDTSPARERAHSVPEIDMHPGLVETSSTSTKPSALDPDAAQPDSSCTNPYSASVSPSANQVLPVGVIPNFSLHASNVFACRIPVEANEAYTSSDHWSWTATQWRGIVGPDLTIYVRDSNDLDMGRPGVEMLEEGNLFVVKRAAAGKGSEIEASASRRLAFEVSEWVRAFGGTAPLSS